MKDLIVFCFLSDSFKMTGSVIEYICVQKKTGMLLLNGERAAQTVCLTSNFVLHRKEK